MYFNGKVNGPHASMKQHTNTQRRNSYLTFNLFPFPWFTHSQNKYLITERNKVINHLLLKFKKYNRLAPSFLF